MAENILQSLTICDQRCPQLAGTTRGERCDNDGGIRRTRKHDFDYDVIVIGAGVAGIYQIKRLVDLGWSATVLEGAGDLGRTWYQTRYLGCRFDSESYTYGFSFSQELLDEWHEAGKIRYFVYNGGTPKYVATLQEVVEKDYQGVSLAHGPGPSTVSRSGDRVTNATDHR